MYQLTTVEVCDIKIPKNIINIELSIFSGISEFKPPANSRTVDNFIVNIFFGRKVVVFCSYKRTRRIVARLDLTVILDPEGGSRVCILDKKLLAR